MAGINGTPKRRTCSECGRETSSGFARVCSRNLCQYYAQVRELVDDFADVLSTGDLEDGFAEALDVAQVMRREDDEP